jgi:hypothetical protein
MKKLALVLLIVSMLPLTAISQEVVSDVVIQNDNAEELKTDFSRSDLISPVLFRSSTDFENSQGLLSPIRDRAGYAFIGSAIFPGLSQAANKNWVRAGVFMAIEAVSIYLAIDYRNRGTRGERSYENWADNNWSVVQYANWLVDYHDVHGISNPYIENLRNMLGGAEPAFDTSVDWARVDLNILRNVERNTPFVMTDDLTANNFSHTLPDYGSQQYYELIAKYFHYQSGWRDFHQYHNSLGHTNGMFNERFFIDRNGVYASPLFWEGVDRAQQFNDNYRTGRNFQMLLIANHMFSAFDAYFTIKLKQNRFEATPSIMPGQQLYMSYRF